MKRYVIATYVENKYGVVARISGMVMRKGYNIVSFTGMQTHDPEYSRITLSLVGDEYARDQLVNQLKKLHNVKRVKLISEEDSMERELLLIKVINSPETRRKVREASQLHQAEILDETDTGLCIQATGESDKLDAFIDEMRPLGIVEMCRTGVVALEKSCNILDK